MASVGAIPHEYRWGNVDKGEDSGTIYFTRQELVEWSIVSAGSNREASQRRNKRGVVVRLLAAKVMVEVSNMKTQAAPFAQPVEAAQQRTGIRTSRYCHHQSGSLT